MVVAASPDFSQRLRALAQAPGVYLMRDAKGDVIYVGKAMRLRDRVRSYFQPRGHADAKTRELVRHITDFEVIRTDTPTEALILENELIKRYLPRYNVMLKDSKTYPYLKITNEEWPRIVSTRRIVDDGGRYFGPYTSAGAAYRTLNLLNRLFPYRKCDKRITGHEEVCLYYHLHQCTAPCIAAVDRETYMKAVESAALFLNGRADEILESLREEMGQASDAWNFERAAEIRIAYRPSTTSWSGRRSSARTRTTLISWQSRAAKAATRASRLDFCEAVDSSDQSSFPCRRALRTPRRKFSPDSSGSFMPMRLSYLPPSCWIERSRRVNASS